MEKERIRFEKDGIIPALKAQKDKGKAYTPLIIRRGNIYQSGGESGQIVSDMGICPTVKQAKRGGMAAIPIVSLDTSQCSQESEGSNLVLKRHRANELRNHGQIVPTLTESHEHKGGTNVPLIVSDSPKSTSMPAKSSNTDSQKSETMGIAQKSIQRICPISTFFAEDSHVRPSQSQEKGWDSRIREERYSSILRELPNPKDHASYSLRMLKDSYHTIKGEHCHHFIHIG